MYFFNYMVNKSIYMIHIHILALYSIVMAIFVLQKKEVIRSSKQSFVCCISVSKKFDYSILANLQLKLFDVLIAPILVYSSEVWGLKINRL